MNAPTQNLPAERKANYGNVAIESHGGGGMLRPTSLAEVVDFAQLMAKADVAVPKHLRGNVGACVSVAMQAFRWEMDPFAVANKSYSVNDRLAYEAQLCAAVVNMRAPIVGRPNYVYEGEGPSRTCQVVCTMLDGEVREYTSPRFDKITTKNSPLWKSDPDQQMGYFAIRSWARRHTPEVLLGVYTPEELSAAREETVRNVTPQPSGLAARLAAGKATATEGFTAATAPHNPETGEVIEEEAQDAHFVENAEAIANEGAADLVKDEPAEEVFPGDRQREPDEFDAPAWAAETNQALADFVTLAALNAFTDDVDNIARFEALEAASPGLAKSLAAAITGRRKALASKEVA